MQNVDSKFRHNVCLNLNTESAVISTLYCLGPFSGVNSKSGSARAIVLRRIGIQPTALERRKRICKGKGIILKVRPSNASLLSGNAKTVPELSASQLPEQRKRRHCLSQAVASNKRKQLKK